MSRKKRKPPVPAVAFEWAHPRLASGLAGIVPLVVYLRTLAPTVYGLDSAELTTGAYVLGIVHAPGAPLYLLLAHLFTWLPIGDIGYRVNLLSACASALTTLLMFRIVRRLTNDILLSLATSWLLAFSYYFWVSAVAAELYAVHGAFLAGLILLSLRWRDEGRAWQLSAIAFLFGLGLGNHMSLILSAPGLAWLVASVPSRPWRQPRQLAAVALWGLCGASVYLYLPLRGYAHPAMDYARDYGVDVATWSGFWAMITCRMFEGQLFAMPLVELPAALLRYLYWLWSNFLNLGALLGIIGFVSDWRHRPRVHLGLLLMFLMHLGFFLTYRVIDVESMFLPTYIIFAIWIALGAQALSQRLSRRYAALSATFGSLLVLYLSLTGLAFNFSSADLSQDRSARAIGEAIFKTIAPGAVYIGVWADAPVLAYLQLVEHQRPDVRVLNLFFVGVAGGGRIAEEQSRAGRAVYTSRPEFFEDGYERFDYLKACGCYRMREGAGRNSSSAK